MVWWVLNLGQFLCEGYKTAFIIKLTDPFIVGPFYKGSHGIHRAGGYAICKPSQVQSKMMKVCLFWASLYGEGFEGCIRNSQHRLQERVINYRMNKTAVTNIPVTKCAVTNIINNE